MFIFCFILLVVGSNLYTENFLERLWTEGWYPYEGKTTEISFENKTETYSSNNKLKVEITSTYPVFKNKILFLCKVVEELQTNAHLAFMKHVEMCVQEEKEGNALDEEAICMDFDKRVIAYSLTPTYASPDLVSVFGELHRYAGMPHGCSRYSSFNYWFDGKEMQKISISHLFLPDTNFAEFITTFCLSTLQHERVGYCSTDPEGHMPIKIDLDDVQVFTLSKSGLTITFRPYHIGGWADGPYSITIPFACLKPFINPQGPLKEFN